MSSNTPHTRLLALITAFVLAAAVPPLAAQSLIRDFVDADVWGRFGASVAVLGDVDGDGFGDVAIGEYQNDAAGSQAGRVTIFSGRDGLVIETIYGNAANAWLGKSLDAVGDVNGDGVPDLVVAAPHDTNAGGFYAGLVRVYSGADWSVIHSWTGSVAGAVWGNMVHGIGDVNFDGRPDVLVASEDENANNQGRVRIYSGATGAVLQEWNGTPGQAFGIPCAPIGDLDGDGAEDVLLGVGSPGAGAPLRAYSGATGGLLHEWMDIIPTSAVVLNSGNGPPMCGLGDVNGDGTDDFAVNHYPFVAGFPEGGVVRVVSGADGSVLNTFGGVGNFEAFGWSLVGPGDLDGDGVPDLVAGAPQAFKAGIGVMVGYVRAISLATGTEIFTVWGTEANERFGESLRSGNDIDGDGLPDVIAGAPRSNGMPLAGYAKVLAGHCDAAFSTFGTGFPGSGGFVPELVGQGCPGLGLTPRANLRNAIGGGWAWFVVGITPASLPFMGGTLYIDMTTTILLPLPLSGASGAPGEGSLSLLMPIPNDPIYAGLDVLMQVVIPDAGAWASYALSSRLTISIE